MGPPGDIPVQPPTGCCNNHTKDMVRMLEDEIGSGIIIPLRYGPLRCLSR